MSHFGRVYSESQAGVEARAHLHAVVQSAPGLADVHLACQCCRTHKSEDVRTTDRRLLLAKKVDTSKRQLDFGAGGIFMVRKFDREF